MCPKDAIAAKDWDRITAATRSAVDKMLGFELRHVGINTENAEESLNVTKKIAALMGWPVKEGNSSNFAGVGFEVMKKMGRGKTASVWDVVLKVRNPGAKARTLAFDFSARPVNSQPVKKHEEFSLAAGAEKLLKVSGPVLDDEKILVEMSVKSANGRYVCFNRARVFAPNAEEPEWMRAPSAVSFKALTTGVLSTSGFWQIVQTCPRDLMFHSCDMLRSSER